MARHDTVIKALKAEGIPAEAEHSFLEWALGPGYETCSLSTWDDRWNALHGDEFHVLPTDKVFETTRKMAKVYLNREPPRCPA